MRLPDMTEEQRAESIRKEYLEPAMAEMMAQIDRAEDGAMMFRLKAAELAPEPKGPAE